MGRKRKGRAVSGWLVVDKPAGITSTAVVNKVRWAFGAAKAGHAGTLDPEATGVLAVALGEATKTVPYITDALKAYRFTVRLGQATNTDDAEGEVIASSDLRPSDDAIKEALHGFVGDIQQVPPKFSAVKIDGQRAYKLAREGEDVEIAARPLWVEELVMTDRPDADRLKELYLYALSREPRPEELGAAQAHLTKKRTQAGEKADDEMTPEKAEQEAFEDILWALVNTKEFLFNH